MMNQRMHALHRWTYTFIAMKSHSDTRTLHAFSEGLNFCFSARDLYNVKSLVFLLSPSIVSSQVQLLVDACMYIYLYIIYDLLAHVSRGPETSPSKRTRTTDGSNS